ncbi:MAG: peptidoglycan-associated lipoprotein Pal [Emcibacter sp.]|nr:peptidoglycan-associated lipoprotein Pal [Emcibacter sp.]
MLEKINGVKYWALIGMALFLNACANTGTVEDTAVDTTVDTQEEVIADPKEEVDVEVVMEDPDTQVSLDAAADAALVYFGYDRYDLSADARAGLKAQAAWLEDHAAVKVTVEGHCDERGTRDYNLALGDMRANSVKNYLVALGVDPSRIHTVSYGKERPAVTGTGESSWSKNRRGYTRVN